MLIGVLVTVRSGTRMKANGAVENHARGRESRHPSQLSGASVQLGSSSRRISEEMLTKGPERGRQ
jgi:hypothetical protein